MANIQVPTSGDVAINKNLNAELATISPANLLILLSSSFYL
jgi:hypothetical protein